MKTVGGFRDEKGACKEKVRKLCEQVTSMGTYPEQPAISDQYSVSASSRGQGL